MLETLAEESMGAADLEAMLGGMETASPEAEPAADEAQGFALALDARAPDTAWTGIRDSILDEDQHEESTYEGTDILYAPPATSDDEGMAAARAGDLILIATTPDDLHPLIDTADGRTPAITSVPEFTAVHDALPTDFLMFLFANSIDTSDADFGPFAMFADQFSTKSFTGLTIAADEPGFRMETVTMAAEGETLPAGADNFESELLTKAPDDSLLFVSAADLGATGVLDVLGATVIGLAMGMGDPSRDAGREHLRRGLHRRAVRGGRIADRHQSADRSLPAAEWRVWGLAGGQSRNRGRVRGVCLRCGGSGDRLQRVAAAFVPDPGRVWRRNAPHDA